MRLHRFLGVVPQPVRVAACAIVCVAVLIGLVAGTIHGHVLGHCSASPVLQSLVGIGMGLLGGSFAAIWILCLGYVYGDARQRAMPPILWTLLAALVPNLLGFLFYFALRRPLASPCPKCGHAIAAEQRFCAWCGRERTSSPSSQTPLQDPGAPS